MLKHIFLFTLVFLVGAFFFGCANDVTGPNQEDVVPAFEVASLSSGMPDYVAGDLDLTPEQREQLKALMQKYQEALHAILQSFRKGGSREELRAQVAALRAKLDEDVKAILTPVQYAKWKDAKGRFGHNGGSKGLFDRFRILAGVLNLSAQQQEQAKAIFDKAHQDIKAAVESTTDKTALRDAIKEILKKAEEQFRGILTPKQLAKYESLSQKRKGPNG